MIKAKHYNLIPYLLIKGLKTKKAEMYEYILRTDECRRIKKNIAAIRREEARRVLQGENPETIAFLDNIFYKKRRKK